MKSKNRDPLPSQADEEGKGWILCGLKKSEERLEDYLDINDVRFPKKADEEEEHFSEVVDPKVKKIDKRAIDDGYLSGKWELAISPKKVDDIWISIKELIHEYKIWGGQVSTRWLREKKDMDEHMIRVYTPNYMDQKDVMRVGRLIKKRCEIKKNMLYKPDIYNVLQIYSEEGEDRKLPKEIRYKL